MAKLITGIDGLKFDISAFADLSALKGPKGDKGDPGDVDDSTESYTSTWSSKKIAEKIAEALSDAGVDNGTGATLTVSATLPYTASAKASVLYVGPTIDGVLINGRVYTFNGEASRKQDGYKYKLTNANGDIELYSEKAYPDIKVGDVLMTYTDGSFTNTTTVQSLVSNTTKFTVVTSNGQTMYADAADSWILISPYSIGAGLKEENGTLSVAIGNGVSVDSTTNEIYIDPENETFVETVTTATESQTASNDTVANLINF